MSNRQTTEQRRAATAWNCIEAVSANLQSEYGSWSRKLPAMIQTNGLGQTLAFLRAKGNAQNLLEKHLADWLGKEMGSNGQFLPWILRQNSGTYRRATTEALAFSLWLRRFAEGQGWGSVQTDE